MDGDIAPLQQIVELAREHDALVMVDDSHATGFVGKRGRGTPEHCGVEGKIDIITSTLGKALGGGSGGFVAAGKRGHRPCCASARGPIFSPTPCRRRSPAPALPPSICWTRPTICAASCSENTAYFRERMKAAGFDIKPGEHPIVAVMLYEFDDRPAALGAPCSISAST